MKENFENSAEEKKDEKVAGSCSFCSDSAAQSCELHDTVVPFCEVCSAEFQEGCIAHEHE